MPNFATAFKAEATRLARKEAKALISPLRKANAQYRRDIADLKRQLKAVQKELGFLSSREKKRLQKAPPVGAAEGKRFSAAGLTSHRERLGLSAADYAELVGVSAQTIYNWEHGRSTPQKAQLAALAKVRGLGKREAVRMLEG